MVQRPHIARHSKAVQNKALCFLHYQYAYSDRDTYTAEEITKSIKNSNLKIVQFSLEELVETPFINHIDVSDELGESYLVYGYSITRTGIKEVESWRDDFYENTAEGIDFLDEKEDKARTVLHTDTGKTLDEWEPLPLERSGEEYEAVVNSVESALKEIESNNGYAAEEPEERNQIVWSLTNGLNQIKDGLPNREQVITMLLKPLRYISRKFADASMGEVAKLAIKALMSWIAF
jgi:hypothetical protein